MKKLFVSADVHSFYDEWMSALEAKEFDIENPDHVIVVLGDLFDRGKKPEECLHFVNALPDDRKILIRGNHEDLLEKALLRRYFQAHDVMNGTAETIRILSGLDKDLYNDAQICGEVLHNEDLNKYLNSLVDYAEVGDNIFVHGWIPCEGMPYNGGLANAEYFPEWRTSSKEKWETSRWLNGMKLWGKGIREQGKTIYCGHWHCSYGHCWLHNDGLEFDDDCAYSETDPNKKVAIFTPFKDEGIVALDACTAYSGIVNCEVIV